MNKKYKSLNIEFISLMFLFLGILITSLVEMIKVIYELNSKIANVLPITNFSFMFGFFALTVFFIIFLLLDGSIYPNLAKERKAVLYAFIPYAIIYFVSIILTLIFFEQSNAASEITLIVFMALNCIFSIFFIIQNILLTVKMNKK